MNDALVELIRARSALWGLYWMPVVPWRAKLRILNDIQSFQRRGFVLDEILEQTGLLKNRYEKWQKDHARLAARQEKIQAAGEQWRQAMGRPSFQISLLFVATALSLIFIWKIDRPLARYFYTLRDTTIYETFVNISYLGQSSLYILFFCIFWIVMRRRDARGSLVSLYLLLSIIASGLAINSLKVIFGRARPELLFSENAYGFTFFNLDLSEVMHQELSYPSGHSATAFTLAVSILLIAPRYRYLWLLAAFLVAFSRIAVFMHYAGDVILGAAIGAVVPVWVLNSLCKNKIQKSFLLD